MKAHRCWRAGSFWILWMAIAVHIAATAGECRAQEEPETPVVKISGHLTRARDAMPLTGLQNTNGKVTVWLDEAVNPPQIWDLAVNNNGYYEGRFQSGLHYILKPTYGHDSELNTFIRSNVHSGLLGPSDTICDFSVTPGVIVTLNQTSASPSVGGVTVAASAPYTPAFPIFVTGTNQVVIYPDSYSNYLGLMPLSGDLILIGLRPFTVATPQNVGQYMQYDCSSTYVDVDTPKIYFQSVVPASDVPANYSWDTPGGIGWSYFPKTPDNRLPNNPDVHVEAEFGGQLGLGNFNRQFIRLNGAYANEDLTQANNHTATFDFPIPDCGPLDLRIEYQLYMQSHMYQWFSLATHRVTSASNADLTGDGNINLSDIPRLAAAFGLCAPQSGYLPCADYVPNGCVDISDMAAWAGIYQTTPAKSLGDLDAAGGVVRFVPTERGTVQCIVDAPRVWSACVVHFVLSGVDAKDLSWTAAAGFIERSLLAPYDRGEDAVSDLIAIAPAAPGATVLGEIAIAEKSGSALPSFVSMGLVTPEQMPGTEIGTGLAIAHLEDVAPNPFNPETVLSFDLPDAREVSLVVYDLAGRTVRTLMDDEVRGAGRHEMKWDGSNDQGTAVPSGVYLYRLFGRGVDVTKRMTLLR
jgi:hypothetical protein